MYDFVQNMTLILSCQGEITQVIRIGIRLPLSESGTIIPAGKKRYQFILYISLSLFDVQIIIVTRNLLVI